MQTNGIQNQNLITVDSNAENDMSMEWEDAENIEIDLNAMKQYRNDQKIEAMEIDSEENEKQENMKQIDRDAKTKIVTTIKASLKLPSQMNCIRISFTQFVALE